MAEPYLRKLRVLVDELDLSEEAHADLESRHFFGGAALYANGNIRVSLTPAGLALKLPKARREAMIRDEAGRPLRYFDGGRIKKEYVVLAQPLASDMRTVRELFLASFRYVLDE